MILDRTHSSAHATSSERPGCATVYDHGKTRYGSNGQSERCDSWRKGTHHGRYVYPCISRTHVHGSRPLLNFVPIWHTYAILFFLRHFTQESQSEKTYVLLKWSKFVFPEARLSLAVSVKKFIYRIFRNKDKADGRRRSSHFKYRTTPAKFSPSPSGLRSTMS